MLGLGARRHLLVEVALGILVAHLGVDQAGLGAQDVERRGRLLAGKPVMHVEHALGHAELLAHAGQRRLVHFDLGFGLRQACFRAG